MEFILVGQPNCGKSTIFNEVAGYKSVASNFPGITVKYTKSHIELENQKISVIDIPGTYSLQTSDEAELAATKYILNASPEYDTSIGQITAMYKSVGFKELFDQGSNIIMVK